VTDTNTGSATTGKVADYAGEELESIKDCAPDAADYTERRDYNKARKAYDNAVWGLTHPKVAKSGPAKVYTLADMHETAIAAIAKKVAAGMSNRDATVAVLTGYANTYHEQVRRFEDMLVLARAL
jgi:hypothetical protein